ncbi:hypothetical protein FQN53_001091 [Emmonsiellopsis sp. PD_33]|nr:hypothetical protein FQN53_001091 [Emmonsiellopsis sp. PD_33]
MDGPPPPPPPHGSNPGTAPPPNANGGYRKSTDLPEGPYDIFIIPPHSSGSGFLYLPSLQCHRNSFLAGVATTLLGVALYIWVLPVVKAWVSTVAQSGGMGVFMMMIAVGVGSWAWGKYQTEASSGTSSPRGTPRPGPAGGSGPRGPPPDPPPTSGPNNHNNGGGPHYQNFRGQYPGGTYGDGPNPGTQYGGGAFPGGQYPPGGHQYTQSQNDGPPPSPNPPPPNPPNPPPNSPPPKPSAGATPDKKDQDWEKAREETKRKEDIRRKMEEFRKKREEEEKEKQRQREKEAREREFRERKEKREKERLAKEAAEKEAAEKAAKEKARAEAAARFAAAREAAAAKRAADKAAAEKSAAEKAAADKAAADKAAAEKMAAEKLAAERLAAEKLAAEKRAESRKAESVKTPSQPRTPSPQKKPPFPSAKTELDDDAYSFRPYDRPRSNINKQPSAPSVFSESSYAPSQSTARTTPPPSRRGPYSTKDPDKVIIAGVYLFNNTFMRTPVGQLVSGKGSVTDGLILRITTEGMFVDDDVRGVPQREWDVKAWTMKLVEVWCPLIGANPPPRQSPTKTNPFRFSSSYAHKAPSSEESDACLANLHRCCKNQCRLGAASSGLGGNGSIIDGNKFQSAELRGLHVVRASLRDQEGKKYVFVLDETEAWKVAIGLQRLRKGSQVRALGVCGMPANETSAVLESLGYT